ncbi:MAG: methionine synthase, partial [Actinomycetota bacterium]|nr:methionine synthase [Actinomycetota bacterium]
MTATGIGSMPGTDIVETVRVVVGELPDFVHLPELPERGAPATMTGRGAAMLSGLAADLQPAGWRIQESPGVDHRRAVSTLARDLDALEEHTQGYTGRLKVQVAGPLTLAAAMERPRGDKVLADFGARRDLAQSLTEGVADHVRGVSARVPGARLLVQVDEPALTA